MAYGELGPTHHSIEDLSWMRAIANLTVVVPADPAPDARRRALGGAPPGGPCYLRIPRFKVPDGHARTTRRSSPGRAVRLTDGDDVTVVADGHDGVARAARRPSGCARRASACGC